MDINFAAFAAISLDGYVARHNGQLDWLKKAASQDANEDYGYQHFIQDVDCILMGRRSFEKMTRYSEWPFQGKRVVVLSKTLRQAPADFKDRITLYNGPIELLAVELQSHRISKVFIYGGETLRSFLKAELVNEITLTQVPVMIGSGQPLFGDLIKDSELRLLSSRSFPSGFVQSHYRVLRHTKNRNN